MLADAFEKFRKIMLSVCLLDPETSLSSRISLKSSSKKNNVKLESLTDIDMFLIVKKKIRNGLNHSIKGTMLKLITNM